MSRHTRPAGGPFNKETPAVEMMSETDESLVGGQNVFCEQNPEERRIIREEYRDLIERAQQGRELIGLVAPVNLASAVEEANRNYAKVKTPLEAAYDSEYLAVLAALGKQKIQSLQTNFRVFDPLEFADKLVRSIGISGEASTRGAEPGDFFGNDETGVESDDDLSSSTSSGTKTAVNKKIEDIKWLKFGRFVNKTILHAPRLKYIYGAFEPGDVQVAVAKQRKAREPQAAAKVTQVTTSKTAEEDDHLEATTRKVQLIDVALKSVVHKCGTVGYWEFLVNPQSFGKTVENIFHFSFLIKDGLAAIKFDENDLPIIYVPGRAAVEAATNSHMSHQFVTNLDMATWREIVKAFEIKEPMLNETVIERALRQVEKMKKVGKNAGK